MKNAFLASFRRKPESRTPCNIWIPHQVRNDERGLQYGCAKVAGKTQGTSR
jgi:hypothetical protein